MVTAQFDNFAVSRMRASAQRALRTKRLVDQSTEEFLLVNIVTSGTNWTEQNGVTAESSAGTITFFDSGLPLESNTTDDAESTMVRAPIQLILDHTGLRREELPTALALPTTGALGVIAGFFRQLVSLPTGELDRAITVLGNDAAVMLGSAVQLAAADTATTAGAADALCTRQLVLGYMRQHCTRPDLTVDEIARACLISRRTLYRVCEGFGEPGAILRRMRVEHARKLLRANPTRALAAIAADSGFATDRHFYRAFREETGFTPGQLREQLGRRPGAH